MFSEHKNSDKYFLRFWGGEGGEGGSRETR